MLLHVDLQGIILKSVHIPLYVSVIVSLGDLLAMDG